MKFLLIVGVGSFFGGIFRYMLSTFMEDKISTHFPYGTLTVNLLGCFAIGCLFGLAERWVLSYELRLLLFTGLLGGFTTFSAFSVESTHLIKTGHIIKGLIYIGTSVVCGLGLTVLGAWIFRFTIPKTV